MKPTLVLPYGDAVEYTVAGTMLVLLLTIIIVLAPASMLKANIYKLILAYVTMVGAVLFLWYGWIKILIWMWS